MFRHKLVLPGIADGQTLELISRLAGEVDVTVRSAHQPAGPAILWPKGAHRSVTTSVRRQRRIPVDQVSRGNQGFGLYIPAGQMPGYLRLTPWWSSPWNLAADGTRSA